MVDLLRTYAACVPMIVWAALLVLGVSVEVTRVPFLVVESVAVAITVNGLTDRYKGL